MESSSSHVQQQQQHPTMTTLEQEEASLLVEFNEKLVVARKNSIATVLPIEVHFVIINRNIWLLDYYTCS
jgi:hypothetical protein